MTQALKKMDYLLTLLVGVLSVAGWAPLAWWPIALLAYATFFFLLAQPRSTLQATYLAFIFGASQHLTGHGWIYDSLHSKTGMAVLPAALGTAIFVIYLALFTAIPCALWRYLRNRSSSNNNGLLDILSLAAILTLGEWMRSLLFNGFTSLSLGYALIDTWLAGYAPLVGTYGLSFLGYALNASVALLFFKNHRSLVIASTVALIITLGGWSLSKIEWVQPEGASLSFRLIQANVAQLQKFDSQWIPQYIQRYVNTIEAQAADVIVTPETAFPVYLNELPSETLARLQNFSQRNHSHLLLGIVTTAADSNGYNSVVHISPFSTALAQYNKVLLMPFGEYTPAGFSWFTNSLHLPLKDLSSGPAHQNAFKIGTHAIGTLICHEDLTSQQALEQLPDTTLFINPSNLAWFEGSLAIQQRIQLVRMRALEIGRPILRVANTGVTAHINHRGQIMTQLPIEYEGVLAGRVQPMKGTTPYTRWGHTIILVLLAFILSPKLLTLIIKKP